MTRPSLYPLAAMSLLAGCASYELSPLRTPSAVLTAPDVAIISQDAQKIIRPYLTPQTINLSVPLTPNALAVLAVLENPDLKVQRAKFGVSDAQAFAARLLPDPTVQGSFDKLLTGPDVFNAYAAQIGQDLNLLRTGRIAQASSEASKRQVRLDLAWAEWQVAGQARLQGVRVLALMSQLYVTRASALLAQRLFDVFERAAKRGDVTASDLDTRRQALLDSTTKARTAESDLATARVDLAKQLGLPPETTLLLASPAASVVPPSAEILIAQALDRRLDLQALRAGYGAAEADLHKAVLDQFPMLSLTGAYARDTADYRTLGPQIGFTLPLWNRNRGGIATARATREQVKAEYEARLLQIRAEISGAVDALLFLRRQRSTLLGHLPKVERYAAATERAAQRGDLAPATADTALQALRDGQLAFLQLDQQIAEQTIDLEVLSGGPSEGWTR